MKVVFPATVPYIFTGLRIGIGLSWLAIVAAEMLVGGVGIGSFIWDAYNTTTETNLSEIILALIYVGLVGLILDRIVGFIASKVVPDRIGNSTRNDWNSLIYQLRITNYELKNDYFC